MFTDKSLAEHFSNQPSESRRRRANLMNRNKYISSHKTTLLKRRLGLWVEWVDHVTLDFIHEFLEFHYCNKKETCMDGELNFTKKWLITNPVHFHVFWEMVVSSVTNDHNKIIFVSGQQCCHTRRQGVSILYAFLLLKLDRQHTRLEQSYQQNKNHQLQADSPTIPTGWADCCWRCSLEEHCPI